MIEPKEHLKNLQRVFEIGESRLYKKRLDRNERNIPFSKDFFENIRKKINDEIIMAYPEVDPIYQKLSKWLNINTDEILLNSGSEQTIKSIFETYIRPGDNIMLHFPGFAMYEVYSKMFQANVLGHYFDSNLNFDWNNFTDNINDTIRMVVVENPNGFIGLQPPMEILEKMIKKTYDLDVIFLIDEAYFHFQANSVIEWIKKYDNLLVTRSFSKALGLAGLRAGFLISQKRNIDNVKKVKPGFEINSIAVLFISEILDHLDEIEYYKAETYDNFVSFKKGLNELGIESSHSKGNFLAVRLGEPEIHNKLRESLLKYNILLRRPYREENLKEWIMIEIASKEIQTIIFDEIKQLIR